MGPGMCCSKCALHRLMSGCSPRAREQRNLWFSSRPNKICSGQQSSTPLQDLSESHSTCPKRRDLIFGSKTAPSVAVYDEPGQPFSNLLNLTGCALGPGSFACLQNVPFDVGGGVVYSTGSLLILIMAGFAQRNQRFDSSASEQSIMAACRRPSR